jgi:septum formation protein
MQRLVLASQSPRRRDLLKEAGFKFEVDAVKVSEIIGENVNPENVVLDLARKKANAVLNLPKYLKEPGFLILAADTLVVLDGRPLGKPSDEAQARYFLSQLAGRTHSVMTGLYLATSDQSRSESCNVGHVEITKVTFRTLSQSEIEKYVATGEPMDKAGAYAIQGEGRKFVSSFVGSWSNVVGLPMEALESLLQKNAWIIDRRKPKKN